jgi:hypothetical protein
MVNDRVDQVISQRNYSNVVQILKFAVEEFTFLILCAYKTSLLIFNNVHSFG